MDTPSPGLSLRDVGWSLRASCLHGHSSSAHSPLMRSPPGQSREISAKAEVDETGWGADQRETRGGQREGMRVEEELAEERELLASSAFPATPSPRPGFTDHPLLTPQALSSLFAWKELYIFALVTSQIWTSSLIRD